MAAHNHNPNPAVSAEQYRLAQAVLSGTARDTGMPVSVAREIVERTPAKLRSEYSRNPVYGMDLDLETTMAPAWKYYDSKAARDTHARLKEGKGQKVVLGHSMFGFKEGGGKKWRMRLADHRGNPMEVVAHFKIKGLPKDSEFNRMPFGRQIEYRHAIQAFKDSAQKGYADSKGRSYTTALKDFLKLHRAGQWYAQTRGKAGDYYHDDSFEVWYKTAGEAENPSKAFGGDVRQQLLSAVTQYDMKEQEKAAKRGPRGYYNMYALPQYLGRVSDVVKDIEAGAPVRKALMNAFTGRLLDVTLKAVGEPRSTKEEQRGGPITYRSARENPRFTVKYLELKDALGRPKPGWYVLDGNEPLGHYDTKEEAERHAEAMYSIRRVLRNPQPAADDMYASFHGEPTDETIEFQNEEHYHSHLAALGELVELKVKLVNGGTAVIGFESSGSEKTNNPVKVIPLYPHQILPGDRIFTAQYGYQTVEKVYPSDPKRMDVIRIDLSRELNKHYPIDRLVTVERGEEENPSTDNPFWPFNSFTHTTIYHVGTGEKYKKSGSYKGYTLYKKLDTDEFLVPALDKDSRFDTLKDVKAFVDSWTKHSKNPGPFHEAGKLIGRGTRAARKPMNDFIGAAGKVGEYLDDELGRALNPQREYKTEASFKKALAKATADGSLIHWYGTDHGWVIVTRKMVNNPSGRDTGPAYLTSNEDGTQLFIVGGDQSLDLPGLGITGTQAEKELVTIGTVTNVVYHAHKIFDDKREEYDYTHKLSEDTHGPLPVLIYDRINQQLKLSGGEYKIERPLVGTSAGIEN